MKCLAQWVKDQANTDIPGGGSFADAEFEFRQVASGICFTEHPAQAQQLRWALQPVRAMLLQLVVISVLMQRSLAGEE